MKKVKLERPRVVGGVAYGKGEYEVDAAVARALGAEDGPVSAAEGDSSGSGGGAASGGTSATKGGASKGAQKQARRGGSGEPRAPSHTLTR